MIELSLSSIVPFLLAAARWTLLLSAIAFVGGGTGAVLLLLLRYGVPKFGKIATTIYIQLIQGTPLLMQLFLVFFGLPLVGIEAPHEIDEILAIFRGPHDLSNAEKAEMERLGAETQPSLAVEDLVVLDAVRRGIPLPPELRAHVLEHGAHHAARLVIVLDEKNGDIVEAHRPGQPVDGRGRADDRTACVGVRKLDDKGRALPVAAAEGLDAAAVQPREVTDDGKTEAQAAVRPRRTAVGLTETVEDVG